MRDDIDAKIKKIIARKNLGERDVAHLMNLTRKRIEQFSEKEQKSFQVLEFFCDWTLHPYIDKSSPAFEIIKEINLAIYTLKKIPDNQLIIDTVSKIVSLKRLSDQFKEFFIKTKTQDVLTTSKSQWARFAKNYIEIIKDCPLILPDPKDFKKSKPFYDEIMKKPQKKGVLIIGFSISEVPQSFFKGSYKPTKKSFLCLVAYLSNTTRLVIPLS